MQLHRYPLPVTVSVLVRKVCIASISGDCTTHSWGRLVQETRVHNDHNIHRLEQQNQHLSDNDIAEVCWLPCA